LRQKDVHAESASSQRTAINLTRKIKGLLADFY
jgi:hypothetical protein